MASGQKIVEDLLRIAIYLKEADIPQLKAMAGRWAAELGQEAIAMEVTDFQVFFVAPRQEGDRP